MVMLTNFLSFSRSIFARLVLLVLVVSIFVSPAQAAQLNNRSLTLSTSAPSASATFSFNFTIPTTATIVQGARFQVCTTASGTCTIPAGFSNSSATLTQPTGLGDTTGWTVDNSTAGYLALHKATNATAPSGSQTITFNSVTNPSTANQTFYVRITTFSTYSAGTYSGAIDTGNVAASTTNQITITGTMDESLVFCVGTSITGQDCSTIAGTAVNFGNFSTTATSTGTSVMAASTNGQSGYAITVTGTTLTSGANTIPALATQTTSTTGTAQFGMNLVSNTTPTVGSNATGTGTATPTSFYGTTNQYRFVSGDSVASSTGATNANAFTVSYIANVPGSQPAGVYSTVLTYICTATF